jgi:hypothetical protein
VALILAGPLLLAVSIVASLFVSYLHVRRSAIVQVEREWIPGEHLAVRAQLIDVRSGVVEQARASLLLRRDGVDTPLVELSPTPAGGLVQGHVEVPAALVGPAELVVTLDDGGGDPLVESVPIELVERRVPRRGEHTVGSSTLNWADDTDPQPEGLRIDLRPLGRLLAGFENRISCRITDLQGKPWTGPARILLVHGEFGGAIGRERDPPVLFEGTTDALGLAEVAGPLASEVIRLEVQATPIAPAGSASAPVRRRFRFVSFPGAVQIGTDAEMVAPGATLELVPHALRAQRPIFVDVHAPDGGWVDTLMPPLLVGEAPRPWRLPASISEGLVQIEAYHYTNAPGEGTAIARVWVGHHDPASPSSLAPLVARQRELLDLPRTDKEFDVERERRWLDHVAGLRPGAADIARARGWLIGSLPVEVLGPPIALMTQLRDEQALAARKAVWTTALRWSMWGTGLVFVLVLAATVWRADQRAARRLAQVLDDSAEGQGEHLERLMLARRATLFRGAVLLVIMVTTLVVAITLMERFVWIA